MCFLLFIRHSFVLQCLLFYIICPQRGDECAVVVIPASFAGSIFNAREIGSSVYQCIIILFPPYTWQMMRNKPDHLRWMNPNCKIANDRQTSREKLKMLAKTKSSAFWSVQSFLVTMSLIFMLLLTEALDLQNTFAWVRYRYPITMITASVFW